MAIAPINYSTLYNNADRQPENITQPQDLTHAKQKDLKLYQSDSAREDFKKNATIINPLNESLQNPDGIGYDQSDHVYEFINKFKICEIAVGSLGKRRKLLTDDAWGKWRSGGSNQAKIDVHPNVLLFPSEKSFQFGYSHEYAKAWEKLSGDGMLSKFSQLAEGLRSAQATFGTGGESNSQSFGGKFVPIYKEAPAWERSTPLKLSSSLKFEFKFGQAGLFSGEHEVVRPILALASLFAPVSDGTKDAYVRGPAPTAPTFLMSLMAATGGKGSNLTEKDEKAVDEVMAGTNTEASSGLIARVTALEQSLIDLQTKAIKNAYDQSSRGLYIRMGRMSWGPCIVKDINWEFDFENVDEYGFPAAGSITFSGLEAPVMPRVDEISQVFDVSVAPPASSGSSSSPSIGKNNSFTY